MLHPKLNLIILTFRSVLRSAVRRDHADLVLENIALRQQLAAYKSQGVRPRITDSDRLFWIALRRWWPRWREALVFVSPDTVVGWHRSGFKAFWRRKSKRRGRPPISADIRSAIKRMHRDNPLWGAPRIHGELLMLDYRIGERSVSRYLVTLGPRTPKPISNQAWATFLRNHAPQFASMDFFTVYDIFFRRHYVFFILDHECRKIRHFAVTKQPDAEWLMNQLREAFSYDYPICRLICDSDPVFSKGVRGFINELGITLYRFRGQPWMNGHSERFVGSARRELLNHVVVLNERHLRRMISAYISYYHEDRTHLSLSKGTPANRDVEKPGDGATLIAEPKLGGLHQRYRWTENDAA